VNNFYLYVPTFTPPTCIPNIISPINSVPNSPEVVQIKSPRIATICLDEPFQATIVTDIVNNRDDFNNIVKSTEVKAQSSTSAKSINEEDTCISLFATDEYVPALKPDETREEVIYEPTPKHILQLKTMTECQKSRISVSTLQSDPSINPIIYGRKAVTYETVQCGQYLYIFPGQRSPSFCSHIKLLAFKL
jgi:hypothetical protein